jgi:hypothetical protein
MEGSTKKSTNVVSVFPAKVAEVIDNYKLVINKGSLHGIREGQRVLVYRLSNEDIIDPDTGESLGNLEIVRGTGKVIHLQENLSTIESDKSSIERRHLNSSRMNPFSTGEIVEIPIPKPFDNPKVGDLVKPI